MASLRWLHREDLPVELAPPAAGVCECDGRHMDAIKLLQRGNRLASLKKPKLSISTLCTAMKADLSTHVHSLHGVCCESSLLPPRGCHLCRFAP